jgi:tetratricopeptide (TPR) repeat protein/transcriptional regulator with XRE-family HTH domain
VAAKEPSARAPFGRLLRHYRHASGLSQEKLAERAGLSARAVSDLERGTTVRPYWHTVAALSAALGLRGADRDEFARASRPASPSADPDRDAGPPLLADHAAPQASAAQPATLTIPRQLPAAVSHFTGRAAEMKALTGLVSQDAGTQAIVISALAGTAGVGKTATAVQWAHQVAAGFPDGQLYVNLRGYDLGQPVAPADALAWFLRALGVPGPEVPSHDDERAAMYRSLLAGRRVLVVLDNARNADQVRPLLPGTQGSVAVVTSRDALAGLVARDGAERLQLDVLPLHDAVALLRSLIGSRVDAEPEVAEALAESCCRLPLALRVAAEMAAARPASRLVSLVAELSDQRRRLELLDAGGDARTAVRTVFSWSYRHLDPVGARAFRLAGEHPGTSLDSHAVAALADIGVEQAAQVLDLLCQACLVHTVGPGRYSQHDLLRAYARELAEACDSPAGRRAALTRLTDYYLGAAATAMDALLSSKDEAQIRRAQSAAQSSLDDPVAALAWLDRERANLVAIGGLAADYQWAEKASQLSRTLFRYLDSGGYYAEGNAIHAYARRAASQAGDLVAKASALVDMGVSEARQVRYIDAIGHLADAQALFREVGDRVGEARALVNLGATHLRQGCYQDAATCLEGALPLLRAAGHPGEASALNNLGMTCLRLGRYQQATDYLDRALRVSRDFGSLPSEARALTNLGIVETRQGRLRQADGHLRQSLALFRQAGDRVGEAYALSSSGDLHLRGEDHHQAERLYQQALAMFREMADRRGEAVTLNDLAGCLLASGDVGAARDQYRAALELVGEIGNQYEQARAHDGLARTYQADGEDQRAQDHWRQALARYEDLGVPEAEHVRRKLAAIQDDAQVSPP